MTDSAVTDRSVEAIMTVLADPDRRALVQYLATTAGRHHTIAEVADQLEQARPGDRSYHAARFVHVYGPSLAEAGILTYDLKTGAIEYRPDRRVEACLESVLACERSPS
ncbi:MAG: hypothetical protein U5K37_09190 [Natrialbaceae archaeon]|nr:hypothetical protein [Natrialbaceae archaeon]